MNSSGFVPALRFSVLTPFYDGVVRITLREKKFKTALLTGAGIKSGYHILDLGCGTGTLTILAKKLFPGVEITGLDADPKILEIARKKAAAEGVEISCDQGMSNLLPYTDDTFDRAISSLFFHHLTRADKLATLTELRRVLRRNGELHIADWGEPSNALMRFVSYGVKILDGPDTTRDSFAGRLLDLLEAAGFIRVKEDSRSFDTIFGTIRIHRSVNP